MEKVRVHLDNEIPRFGCGQRFVTVTKLGRKWVSLETSTGKRARIKRRLWDDIKKVAA